MKIQEFVSDVRTRVETASKHYQNAFRAYVDAQRKAVGIVTKNGQTLANTEIGAAKNVFAAARASFDKARQDGVRKIANDPQSYVPNGRDQIVSAYKDTIDLLVKTGNELSDVVTHGYKTVVSTLSGEPAVSKRESAKQTPKKTAPKKTASSGTATKQKTTTSARRSTTKKASTRATGSKSSAS